jgi:Mn2+/Fe2+ NRAMP family transporter
MFRRFWRRRLAYSRILVFLSVLGPGIIAANADNDATGILGYSLAGAAYQYSMLWVLVVSTIALGVAQEICARMGAVTGKGLADLIREEYGVRITILAMLTLLVANFTTTIAEFAGMLASMQALSSPAWHDAIRFVALPFTAVGIWLLVTRGTYRRVERILLAASLIYLSYVLSAFLVHPPPPWGQVFKEIFVPNFKLATPLNAYIFMVINVIGTTITPWGQFYIQSSIRDKGLRAEEYGYTRVDVFFGAFFTNFIAFFIIVCCGATLFHHVNPDALKDAGAYAKALAPFGTMATVLFAVGLFNASCFGAIAVPLSTAYAVTEALGWESGVGRRTREAPLFIGVYTFLIAVSAAVVMLFPKHLTMLMILPNIVGGILLPIILVLMLLLINKRRLMGHFTNSRTYNAIAWVTTVVIVLLSLILLVTSLFGGGG